MVRFSGLLATTVCVFAAHGALALSVNPNIDANTLAGVILGSGVTINGATFSGGPTAGGTFSDGAAIGISDGIILSSGNVADAVGPNNADGTTTNFGLPGAAPVNGNDAAVLTIDFTTTTGDLFFNYVFASEEYNEFTNSTFNDSFQFLLDGNTAADNIALIPGTNTPVEINSVNGGNPFGTGASNSQFFNNNDLDDGGPFFNIEYDGFTDVFTASAIGLDISTAHSISLIVQDVGDFILDSAVFIQGGSFGGTPTPPDEIPPNGIVPIPAALPLLLTGLLGLGFIGRRRRA